ncbi:MAG TPA: hypothetical protein VHH34_04860, partial [Pseudonocardiaceae bacterium]|nr:hypothetical protein [Pseudonocardiaceae bacterium]
LSMRHDCCLLVGVVDYRQTRGSFQAPDMWPLEKVPVHAASDDLPPVWLVMGRHGQADRHLIPGDPATGLPDTRHWAHGGQFAWSHDGRFRQLAGNRNAVRVHDYREAGW